MALDQTGESLAAVIGPQLDALDADPTLNPAPGDDIATQRSKLTARRQRTIEITTGAVMQHIVTNAVVTVTVAGVTVGTAAVPGVGVPPGAVS